MAGIRIRRLAAVGTLIACTTSGAASLERAYAQEIAASRSARSVPEITTQSQEIDFNISPGRLEDVLRAFEHAAGYKITVPDAQMNTLASPGVSGVYSVERALGKILTATGLEFRFTAPTAVTLQVKKVSTSVEVSAPAIAFDGASPKYTERQLDTPQTITAVTSETMAQQGAITLRDALRNVAGISLAAGEGGAQGDNLTIRGFTARNDLYIDGMRDFGSYYRDPFNTQEVEALQGPSSVTFGRGSTGGVVNQESKTAGLSRIFAAEADFGTDLTRRVTMDFDTPLSKFGPGAAFRVNLMGNEGDVAGRDVAKNRRFGVGSSLAFGLGTYTRWTFSDLHQTASDIPDYGIPWLFNGPAQVDRNNYYGFAKGNFLRTYDDIGTAKVEHDVNSQVTVRDQVRYANYVRHALITEAQIPAGVTLGTPLSAININRNEITVNSVETYLDEQLDVTANFSTGLLHHSLAGGLEAGRETSDPTRPKYSNVPATSLLDPDPTQAFTANAAPNTQVTTTAITGAAYVLDSVHMGKQWDLTGGFRFDRFDTDYHQYVAPASAFTRVDNMPSWRAALVYKPVASASLYASAGTSFNPSAETLSLSAANANLPPERNLTYETGAKWDPAGGKLSLRAALFQTTKTNAREPDPNNPTLNVLAGTQRVNGVQIDARGHLTRRWEFLSSYALLDAKVIASQYYPASIGAQLANVPRNSFNAWSNYHLPWHAEFGAGGNYVSSRTASSTVPLDPVTGFVKEVPGYWVFNLRAEKRLNEHLDFQVNVNNAVNRLYYDQLHPAHIVLGPGRSALIGLKFKF